MRSLGSRPNGLRLERIQASPQWGGDAFRNVHPVMAGLRDPDAALPIFDVLFGGTLRAPAHPLPSLDPRHAWLRAPDSGLRATWLGHSTVLIEIDGVRVLTDPVWGARASPFAFAGPKRYQPAPVALDALPPIDVVLISHDHYDHLDYPTIRALASTDSTFVTSLGVGAHLEGWGVAAERIVELDWWESYEHRGVAIAAAPSQHFSGRTPGSRNATLWSSFAIRSHRHAVFFSGDTGLTTQQREIAARLGPFDLVMLEVGGWHAAWGDMHLGPDNAMKALEFLGGGTLLPIHWATFTLAPHGWSEPANRLLQLAEKNRARLVMPRLGEATEPLNAPDRVDAWWRHAGREHRGIVVPVAIGRLP